MKPFSLETPLGHTLNISVFEGDGKKGVVVISSATGVLQKYYRQFAAYLQELGYTVFTFDYHSIGSSEKEIRRNEINLSQWAVNDQANVLQYAKKMASKQPLYLVTHSIGGQLFGLNPNYHLVKKVLMIAPQTGYWRYYKGVHYIKMWMFWHLLIPGLTPIFGYFPARKMGLFENIPKNVAYEWVRWGKHPLYMLGNLKNEEHYFNEINLPIKYLTFPGDTYAPVEAAHWMVSQFKSARVTHMHIDPEKEGLPPIGHFGFFRSKFKHSLWNDSINWLESE